MGQESKCHLRTLNVIYNDGYFVGICAFFVSCVKEMLQPRTSGAFY